MVQTKVLVSLPTVIASSSSDSSNVSIISSFKDEFIAGAFAGFIARLLTAPFDLIKIRIQLQSRTNVKYTSILDAFRKISRDEGISAFWKGNLSATYLWMSYAMVQFTIYSVLKKYGDRVIEGSLDTSSTTLPSSKRNEKGRSENNFKRKNIWLSRTFTLFCAGASAALIATLATYPFDIMRTQFAIQGNNQVYPNIKSFMTQTFQTKGIKGFYAGLAPALVGITPYMGLNFAFYESLKGLIDGPFQQFTNHKPGSVASLLVQIASNSICGAFAGGASKFIVYPLDTIKKQIQAQNLHTTFLGTVTRKYKGTFDCGRTILQHEGIKGFYKGIVPTTLKSVSSTAISFAAFEGAKDFLVWNRKRSHEDGSSSSSSSSSGDRIKKSNNVISSNSKNKKNDKSIDLTKTR